MKLRAFAGSLFSRDPLALRFLFAIVSFSSLITLAATALQLRADYTYMVGNIRSAFSEIEAGHLGSLSNSVWVLDERQITSHLAGILQMSDINGAVITVDGTTRWSAGEPHAGRLMRASFPLRHVHRSEQVDIGTLQVTASLDAVYQRLFDKVLVILVSNGVKTFLVGILVFIVFHRLIARHIAHIAGHANSFEFVSGHAAQPLRLNRDKKPGRPDILDRLTDAYNEMNDRLSRSYATLLAREDSLAELNVALEQKIAEQQATAVELRLVNENLEQRVFERTQQLEQEVAERRYVEIALRDSEERFRDIAEASSDWFWEMGPDLRYRFMSARGFELTGFSSADLVGKTREEFLGAPGEAYGAAWEEYQAALSNQRAFRNVELPFRTKDGSEKTVRLSAKPVLDADGGFAGYRGSATDITEIKVTEERLRMFERMVEAAGQGLGLGTVDGKIIYVNAALSSMLGAPNPEAVIGSEFFRYYSDDDRAILTEEGLKQTFLNGGWSGELVLNGPSGKTTPTIHDMFPIKNVGGELILGTVITDISHQVQQSEMLRHAKEEADRANTAKSEFLANMSHELRTPLNAILGFSQILELNRQKNLSDKELEYVQLVIKSGHHLLDLINDVLDLAKVESGKIGLSIEDVELRDALAESLPLIETMAEPRGIAITVGPGVTKCPALRADHTRLKQMLLNLLSNAVKYNNPGGSILIDSQPVAGDRARVSVADTGPGIPRRKQEGLFVPFSRLGAENSGIEGTGIGLALTKRLAEMMGGSVGFESREGEGSSFWIELPFKRQALNEQARASALSDADLEHRSLMLAAEKKVLYVEDNPSNLRLMEALIEGVADVRLYSAHTAELGLHVAEAEKPDLIIIDINLPGINGIEMLRRLRKNPIFANTPIIALSANAMNREIESGLVAGFDRYLTKPLDVEELMDAFRAYLAGKSN